MLVLNPDRRISIEDALKHSYVDLYEPEDPVEPMGSYDTSIETRNLNIDEWRSNFASIEQGAKSF